MLNRFAKWSLLLAAMLCFSLILAACGYNPTPAPGNNQPQATATPTPAPTGVKSAMINHFPDSTVLYVTINTDSSSDQVKGWQKMMDYLSNIPEVKAALQQVDVLQTAKLGTYNDDIK